MTLLIYYKQEIGTTIESALILGVQYTVSCARHSLRNMVTGTFPPGSFHLCVSPRFFSPRKFLPHVKYTVDANLFRLESPILTRANYKPSGGSIPSGVKKPRGGGNFRGGKTGGWKLPGEKGLSTRNISRVEHRSWKTMEACLRHINCRNLTHESADK